MFFNSKTLSKLVLVGTVALPTLLPSISTCPFVDGAIGGTGDDIPEGHPDFNKPYPRWLCTKEEVFALVTALASAKHSLRGGRKVIQDHHILSTGAGGCITQPLHDSIAPDIQNISDAMTDITDA